MLRNYFFKQKLLVVIMLNLLSLKVIAQSNDSIQKNQGGWFSLGGRSTISVFDADGLGVGTGGQFRLRLSNDVNTDWFADYISINVNNKLRSEYYHIGWSVLYYPKSSMEQHNKFMPYILAGHCFDYNKKTEIANSANYKERWGSAVQAGLGVHYFLSRRVDFSLTSQYMIHLTSEINYTENNNAIVFYKAANQPSLEGHLLTTLSFNCKLFKLWNR